MMFFAPRTAWSVVGLMLSVAHAHAQDTAITGQPGPAPERVGAAEPTTLLAASSELTLRNKPNTDKDATPAVDLVAPTGFVANSKMGLLFRNYSEHLEIHGFPTRNAWVQGIQAKFESGYTDGPVGFGLDVSPFFAGKLNGGKGSGNMVHVGPHPEDANKKAWAYWGNYAVKVQLPGVTVKYGLLPLSNPFLEPYDIRSLPPAFRGVLLVATPLPSLQLQAGSFDAVDARGSTVLQPLSTSYGGIRFDRMRYLGGDWDYSNNGRVSVYANQAKNLWNQYYASSTRSVGAPTSIKWTGRADIYYTRDQGTAVQGLIDNKAYSLSLTALHGASSILLGYQRILGNQFFDFTQETSGIFLSNSMGTDFNAPKEQSIQLRYKLDGNAMGIPGFQASLWAISGWGVDASVEANRYLDPASLLHALYWKSGRYLQGGHQEFGFNPSYLIKNGALSGVKVSLVLIAHNITPYYPSKTFRDVRLMVDFPLRVF